MRHPQHWYFPQFRCNMRKISAKRYRRAKLEMDSHTTGPGFKIRLVRYVLPSFRLTTNITAVSLVCVKGRGRISQSGLTQDIKMGSCEFQCDVPHQWITQRQVGQCLYIVTGWGGVLLSLSAT